MFLHILTWKYLVYTNIYALKIDYFAVFSNKLFRMFCKMFCNRYMHSIAFSRDCYLQGDLISDVCSLLTSYTFANILSMFPVTIC